MRIKQKDILILSRSFGSFAGGLELLRELVDTRLQQMLSLQHQLDSEHLDAVLDNQDGVRCQSGAKLSQSADCEHFPTAERFGLRRARMPAPPQVTTPFIQGVLHCWIDHHHQGRHDALHVIKQYLVMPSTNVPSMLAQVFLGTGSMSRLHQ